MPRPRNAYAGLLMARHQHRFRHRRLAFLKQSQLRRESTSNRVSIDPHLNRQAVRRNIVWRLRGTPWISRHFRILLLFQQRPCVAPIRLTAQNHPRAGGKRLAIRTERLRCFMHLHKPHTQRVQHLRGSRVVVLLQRHHERIRRPVLFYRILAHSVRVAHQRLAQSRGVAEARHRRCKVILYDVPQAPDPALPRQRMIPRYFLWRFSPVRL